MKQLYIILSILFCINTSVAQTTLSNGLLACYSLNGNALDGSGNNINGTVYGSPILGTDHYGNANNAYYFDGVDDYIDVTNSLLLQPTQWTYSAWVNFSSNPGLGLNAYILSIGGAGATQTIAVNNNSNVNNQGLIATTYEEVGSTPTFVLSGSLPTLGSWYHVVGVRETDTIRLYINGVQVQKAATTSSAITYGSAAYFATIAARQNTSNGLFNGYMDNVRIYSRPLSSTEVSQLYTTTSGCFTPTDITSGMLACYSLNGNANDGSGNNINGTIYGSPTLGTDHYGNASNAFYFDGVDDYIDITNSLLFQPTQWTYSAWLNFSSNPSVGLNAYILSIGGAGATQGIAVNNNSNVSNQGLISTTYEAVGSTPTFVLSGSLPTLGSWYHVVGVRETDTIRLYVNGVQVQRAITTSSAISYGNATNFATIAARQNTSNGLFNGYMDNVRIYSRPLTAGEVSTLYTTTSTCGSIPITTGMLNSIGSSSLQNFIAYPNPSRDGMCNIQFPANASGSYQVKVYSSKGTAQIITTIDTSSPVLDLSYLPKGIYMISFLQNSTQANAKIVIE
jgi:hypothetical protein